MDIVAERLQAATASLTPPFAVVDLAAPNEFGGGAFESPDWWEPSVMATVHHRRVMNTHGSRRFAVITGASSGIGYEFAKVCAGENFEVLLIADQGVEEATARLRADGAAVTGLQADLAAYDGNEGVVAAIQQGGRPVDVLALNAGRLVGGPFLEADLERDLALIQLNIGSVVHLSKRLLPAMVARGEGRVLITSSIAATMPGALLRHVRRLEGLSVVLCRGHPIRAEGHRRHRYRFTARADRHRDLRPRRHAEYPGRRGPQGRSHRGGTGRFQSLDGGRRQGGSRIGEEPAPDSSGPGGT